MGLGDSDEDRWIMRKIICLWGIRGGKKNHKVCIRCTVYGKRLAVGGLLRYLVVFCLIPYTLDLKPYFVHRRPFFYE